MTGCDQAFRDFLAKLVAQDRSPVKLVIGFSGGLDSTVLLHLAHRYSGANIRAIHVNHGYDASARQWQAHCEQTCAELGVRLQSFSLAPSDSGFSESRARAARYKCFSDAIVDDELLLLAHHRDDAAETLLLHLFQGRGSYAMPVRRPLGRAQLWRPLLSLDRAELRVYAESHDLQWLEDPSNDDRQHDRNFLRHEILPPLSGRFDSLPQRLAQASGQVQTMETLLVELLELNQRALPLQVFVPRSVAEQLTVIRLWLHANNQSQPSTKSLENFLGALATAATDRQPELRWDGTRLRRFDDRLWCIREVAPQLESLPISWPGAWNLPQGQLRINGEDGGPVPSGEVTLHFWQAPGFACESNIRTGGHRRAIKEILRVAGVPPWRRRGYPILADEQGVLSVPPLAFRDDVQCAEGGMCVDWRPDD